jgi:hypothetical protein
LGLRIAGEGEIEGRDNIRKEKGRRIRNGGMKGGEAGDRESKY